MRMLSKAKWLTASGGLFCLATILALSLHLPGHPAQRTVAASHASSNLFHATPLSAIKTTPGSKVDVAKHYGELPLAFEPAASSSSSPAQYLARGNGYALFLAQSEAVLELRSSSKTPAILRMQLAGANSAPRFTPLDRLPGTSSYFIGNNPKTWRTEVPQYRKVLESEVYPGVNLVYYGTQGRLEYDFDVAPGGDPSAIRLAFQNAKDVRIDAQGELVARTEAGDVRLRKPVAYQEIAGSQKPVAVKYALKANDNVSFELAEYDPRSPLVIDPILIYSTYLGGSGIDSANAIALAPSDNTAFIAGATFSTNFPTAHPLQANAGGNPDFPSDAFVSKISADGSTLLYSTYLGGANRDSANGIAIDNAGNAFVTGTTLSPDYPVVTGSFDTECGGDGKCGASFNNGLLVSNAFVTELNPAGSALVYSGFIGLDENVSGLAIAVDINDNAYVTGSTQQNPAIPFFTTSNAFEGSFNNGVTTGIIQTTTEAFIVKIGSTGKSILYSSFLGGQVEEVGNGIAVDNNANAYITGLSYSPSPNFPTLGAFQATNAGAGDAFVTKVNTNGTSGTSLVFSTYLGGTGLDQGNAIALDSNGNIYVAGATNSAPATLGFTPPATPVVQAAYGGQGDAFVAELSNAGTLTYFTYLGGSNADSATGIAVDSTFNVYVTGTTTSVDFPTAGAVFQPVYGGGNTDSFVAKIGPVGTPLVYSSYLGGTNAELATGIAVDPNGSVYVTGQTCSNDFPLANALQAVPGGNCDAYISKVSILTGFTINADSLTFGAQSLNTTSQAQTVTLTNGDNVETIQSIAITGANAADFNETNTCPVSPATLAVGATCTINVTFTPNANGVLAASLVITPAVGSAQTIKLTGTTSTVELSASSLDFGNQQVDVASAPKVVTLTNVGNTPLTISSVVASGNFSESDNCAATLQAGSNCVIQVFFTPTAPVASVGSVTINDNGSGSPQEILTTGIGILQPQAVLSPVDLGFGSEPIGSTTAGQIVTLTNTGDSALSIANIVTTGNFAQANTCGSSLAAGNTCSIGVTFTPTGAGTMLGTLTVTDNAGNVTGSTQTASLLGVGLAVPVVTLSTTSLTFPVTSIGSSSPLQTVTLSNTGNASLLITNIVVAGNFAQNSNCPATLSAASSCLINIEFNPLTAGNQFGTVTITDNAANSPQIINMSGQGNGASFAVSPLTPTASVSAGKPAAYNVSVTSPNGFSQPVNLTCSAPATLTCTIAPSPVSPTATQSTVAVMTVSTQLRTAAPPVTGIKIDPLNFLRHFNTTWLLWLAAMFMILTAAALRRRPVTAAFGFAVVLLLASVACGGGASGVPAGTPAGTYQITITGTSGSTTAPPVTVTLNVS